MSSTQSFMRQRVVGTTTFAVPSAGTTQLYCLVAGPTAATTAAAGNYLGNYPPGYLVAGPTIVNLAAANQGAITTPVLRDMGKTIKASLADSTVALFGSQGFWRAVQVLEPSVVSDGNSGITGQAPGFRPLATGGNNGDKGYNTYYVPIMVNGVVPGTAALLSLPLPVTDLTMIAGTVM